MRARRIEDPNVNVCEHKWVLNRCVKCDARRGDSATHYDQLTKDNAQLRHDAAMFREAASANDALHRDAIHSLRKTIAELRTMASSRLETMHVQSDQLDRQRTEIERLNKRLDRGRHGD